MFEPDDNQGIIVHFNSYDQLLYKENYGGAQRNRAYVKIYVNRKYVNEAYVYCDDEMDGREYIIINNTVEYLDQLNTLPELPVILTMILDKYKISHEDFHSKKRDAYIVKGRHLYMFILRKIYEIPLLMCGKLTSRNHASVLHACKTIQDAYDVDKRFKKEFITIINKIYANEYKHIHSSQRPEEIS
jgi:hypothetical protein